MTNRILAVIFALLLSVGFYQQHKLSTQADLLASTQSTLEDRTASLEIMRKNVVLKNELQGLKDDVSLLLAQSTIVIQNNAQVNINSLNGVKEVMKNDEKKTGINPDALDPRLEQWLRQYEAKRVH